MVTTVQVPVSLGGTNVPYNDGTGAYGMKSDNGYGYATYQMPMLAEVMAACQAAVNLAAAFPSNVGAKLVTTTLAAPASTGSANPNYFLRNVDSAGSRALDLGVSGATAWIQSRDKNDYSVQYALALQPNGGTTSVGGDLNTAATVSVGTKLAVGAAPLSDRMVYISGTTGTAGVNQFGAVINPTFPNTATSGLFGVYTGVNLASGATLTTAYGLYLEAGNFAGSTVTNKYGLYQAGASDTNFFAGPINAASGQVKFPASQNASADPNTLDDYEEGTWTPSVEFSGAAVGLTYVNQSGSYVKVGKAVHIRSYIRLSAKGSSAGNLRINGLPFPSENVGSAYTNLCMWIDSLVGIAGHMQAYLDPNTTYTGTVHYLGTGTPNSVTDANVVDSSGFMMSGTYFAS